MTSERSLQALEAGLSLESLPLTPSAPRDEAVFVIVCLLNVWAAERLQRRVDELDKLRAA